MFLSGRFFVPLCLVLGAILVTPLHAAPPGILNHQGRIAVDGVNYDGTGHFKFALFTVVDSAEVALWSNDGSASIPLEPLLGVPVEVTNGHFALPLGDTSFHGNMTNAIPADLFAAHAEVWLGIWFSASSTGPFEALTPAQRLASVPYALSAAQAEVAVEAQSVEVGAITAEMLADGAVSGLDSADGELMGVVQIGGNGQVAIGPGADLSAPFAPTQAGGIDTIFASSVAVVGNYAYVVDNDAVSNEFRVIDLSDPQNPVEVGSSTGLAPGFLSLQAVAVAGTHAYVVDDWTDKLHIIDVSDPANPGEVGSTIGAASGLSAPRSVAVVGDYAYVVDLNTDKLHVFDVSDPTDPTEVGSTTGAGSGLSDPRSVAVVGDYAYVLEWDTANLHVFDVSNPTIPTEVGSSPGGLSFPRSVAVVGDYAYVVDNGTDKLHVFDVSNPTNPVEVGSSTGSGLEFPRRVAVSGTYAYVVDNGTEKLHVFDVSNPTNPMEVGLGTGLLSPATLAVADNYAVVADNSKGLRVFDLVTTAVVGGSLGLAQGGSLKFSDGSVQSTAFGANAVTSSEIADGSITAADLDASNVGLWSVSGGDVYRFSGKVGLGVSNPVTLLDLSGGSDPTLRIRSDGVNEISGRVSLRQSNDTGFDLYYDGRTAQDGLAFESYSSGTSGGVPLYIDLDGQIGMGTTDPITQLHLHADEGNGPDIRFTDNDTGTSSGDGVELGMDSNEDGFFWNYESGGEVYFGASNIERMRISLAGVTVKGVFDNQSDRASKTDFAPIDAHAVLDRLIELPLSTWRFKDAAERRHIGPVAQDFHAAFNDLLDLNGPDTVIAPLDEAGVAFASIQALHAKVEAENAELKSENAELRTRLERVEALVKQLAAEN